MRFPRLGVRVRLSVWYAASLALAVTAFGFVVYGVVRYQLVRHHDYGLRSAAASVEHVIAQTEDCEHLTAQQTAALDSIGQLVLFHEIEGSRRVFYRSPEATRVLTAVERLADENFVGQDTFETVESPFGPLRLYSRPYRSRMGRLGMIRVVQDLGDIVEPLATLRLVLLLMAPLAVGLSAIGGYWLAGRALSPIARITELAIEIEADRLDRRIPDVGPRDEVGRLVETLNQMIGRLESSFNGMKRFTADASHELRGPLATMRSAVDIALARTRTSEDYQEVLRSVGDDTDRLRAIVEHLLLLARADAGRVKLDRSTVRLDVIASEVVDAFAESAAVSNVVVQARSPAPVLLEGDERWLRQLVVNLVDNAVKFSANRSSMNSATVLVTTEKQGGSAILTVEDDGPGLPPDALDRVFERFFRGEDSRPIRGAEGFGLGLSIADWIVRSHGGRIQAENRVAGGCKFSVTLPGVTTA